MSNGPGSPGDTQAMSEHDDRQWCWAMYAPNDRCVREAGHPGPHFNKVSGHEWYDDCDHQFPGPGTTDYVEDPRRCGECDQVIGVENPERFLRYMGVRRPLKTLDEVNAAGEGFPAITAFVDWLRANGMEIGLRPVLPGARLIPVEDEAEKFSAAFYDISWEQLQADRAEFVYRMQQAQSSPTEPGDRRER